MNAHDISPRRFPRSPTVTPPRWKKPEDVMRKHKVRMKENALLARMNNTPTSPKNGSPFKRKNPFSVRCGGGMEKKCKEDESVGENSLLEILGFSESPSFAEPPSGSRLQISSTTPASNVQIVVDGDDQLTCLPIDWTLRTKMRFISSKPLPWSLTLKTCEEASGITGFVRCIDWRSEAKVDTSPNGQFHQSCLVWVQPNLPWLEVYPRHNIRRSGKPSPFLTSPNVKEALYDDWAKSFRSLFQLVRARHCPYFYMATNTFTCLFRAPGINGTTEINALICPTTIGLRKLLTNDGISFSEPLRIEKRRSSGGMVEEGEEADIDEELEKVEEDEGDWLSSLGIADGDVCSIRDPQDLGAVKKEEKDVGKDESLVRVDGCDAQALLNFLINCKSVVEPGGPLSGIPPTLISPVAFPGGTLTPLKVSESTVKVDGERFHTMEVRGPILPSTVMNFTSILDQQLDAFSITFANVDPTKSFSFVTELGNECRSPEKGSSAFDKGALSDSGLDSNLLPAFCSPNLKAFDSIRYDGKYYLS